MKFAVVLSLLFIGCSSQSNQSEMLSCQEVYTFPSQKASLRFVSSNDDVQAKRCTLSFGGGDCASGITIKDNMLACEESSVLACKQLVRSGNKGLYADYAMYSCMTTNGSYHRSMIWCDDTNAKIVSHSSGSETIRRVNY